MTLEQQTSFINHIRNTLSKHPELFDRVISAATAGMSSAIDEANQRAVSMEVLAVAMHSTIDQRYSKSTKQWIDRLVESKVTQYLDSSMTANLDSLLPKD